MPHRWQPLSFRFETQLLDGEGRIIIRQPDLHEANIYVVCMECNTWTYIVGRLRQGSAAVTMSNAARCTCELLDVSTWAETRYIRGLNRGCPIHPQTEHDLRVVAAEEHRRAIVEAAERAAREAP
jgi:hypothetical protein